MPAAVADEEDLIVEREEKTKDDKEKGGKEKDDSKSELESLRQRAEKAERERDEALESERAWAKRAGAKDDEPKEKKKEAVAEDELDPEKFVEEFTKNPKGALAKLIKGMGMVTREQAEALADDRASKKVRAAVQAVGEDQKLLRDYPDLAKADSALFKRTREIFQEDAGDDPDARRDPRLLRAAARAAKAEIERDDRAAKAKKGESEEERESRIRRQGERGGRSSEAEDDDMELGPETTKIMDAFGIKPENRDRVKTAVAKAKRTYGEM